MKTDLAPKYTLKIDATSILWFQKSNRYIVVSESIYTLISLYLEVTSKADFINELQDVLQIDNSECETIYTEISNFLIDANKSYEDDAEATVLQSIPKITRAQTYDFGGKVIRINFQSEIIESLIHPQIEHHLTDHSKHFDIEFDVFKRSDTLYLFKNKSFVCSFKTEAFHLLQGRFALELTNAIHNTDPHKWVATFHASTITNTSEAIMIIGDSGNGKSTLSALLMANGFELLADDFSPFYETKNVFRYPAAISIKKGAFEILEPHFRGFNKLKTHMNGPKKVNLKYLPPKSNFNSSPSNFPCQTIVSVKYDQTKASELKQVSVEKIVSTLIPDSWISPNETHAHLFLNWLKHVKCYELNYSDSAFALSKFKTLFDE
ncbi:hypothetical protein [Psychroserpens sp. SPM9]|uniref:hypothetical protein n=1 Tax=Psychroserpens sp. SPM9 TaxID=2975598 RepID=UPI0021A6B0D1|nr:hypothetical protein [Psychroserpens sp. SPM9]MDG5490155.1 hypothetical protein [Psychroserpens sp. SPM9]